MAAGVVAYLALGSNLGDRLSNLAGAVRALTEAGRRPTGTSSPCLTVVGVSPVYETTPVGANGVMVHGHPAYLNCAVAIRTQLTPLELLWLTAGIEAAMGRVRHERWGPRTIDIDLILFGNQCIDLPHLQVPHPRLPERAFILRPLLDLDPSLVAPDGTALASYISALAPQDLRLYLPAARLQEGIGAAGPGTRVDHGGSEEGS